MASRPEAPGQVQRVHGLGLGLAEDGLAHRLKLPVDLGFAHLQHTGRSQREGQGGHGRGKCAPASVSHGWRHTSEIDTGELLSLGTSLFGYFLQNAEHVSVALGRGGAQVQGPPFLRGSQVGTFSYFPAARSVLSANAVT